MNKKIVIIIVSLIITGILLVGANVLMNKENLENNATVSGTTFVPEKNEKTTELNQEITSVEHETTTQYSSTVAYTINGNEIILEVQGEADESKPEQTPYSGKIVIE